MSKKVIRSISINGNLDSWLRKHGINTSRECEKFLVSLANMSDDDFNSYVADSEVALAESQIKELQCRIESLRLKNDKKTKGIA